jgi:hypothetical protein
VPFTSEIVGSFLSEDSSYVCEKYQSKIYRNSWVFSGYSDFLEQGMLTGLFGRSPKLIKVLYMENVIREFWFNADPIQCNSSWVLISVVQQQTLKHILVNLHISHRTLEQCLLRCLCVKKIKSSHPTWKSQRPARTGNK